MIARLIEWSLGNRFLVLCALLLATGWGVRAVYRTPVDAIPDLSENQVIVFAEWPGRSPQEVEDQVTYPLSVNLQGLAGVKTVRALSMFGFSLVTVIFEDRVDNYFARARVLERLNYLGALMPAGVVPLLGPDATGLGWVYQYYLDVATHAVAEAGSQVSSQKPRASPSAENTTLHTPHSTHLTDLGELRALQDWFIRYQLQAVPGVAEVASIGGFVKQYQIEVSPARMRARGVTLKDVLDAVAAANLNVGGRVIEENGMEFVVRGVGLVKSIADLEEIPLKTVEGTPVYLRDVASIELGGDFRRGALDVDGREVVGGIVVMRTGENAMEVIRRVKEKISAIQPSLPPGVTIRSFYDRSELIARTVDTLKHALIEEVILVTLAHVVFLFHFRSILIVTIPLPVSILIAFILMNAFGISSNIMSLSGIAIAIGVLVDAGIVMTENVIRHCERAEAAKALGRAGPHPGPLPEGEGAGMDPLGAASLASESRNLTTKPGAPLPTALPPGVGPGVRAARLTPAETLACTLAAARQVGRPIFFAMAIILLAFAPVFALEGQEGKLFHPLAWTKTFAIFGATLLGVTVVPVLCSFLVRGPFHREEDNRVMRLLLALYRPTLDWALRHRGLTLGLAALILALSQVMAWGLPRGWQAELEARAPALAPVTRGFGREFMPTLEEGSLLYMPVLLPSTSLTEVKRIMAWQDEVMSRVPEVASVAGKLGRAETATDPAPVEMIETTLMLKPRSEWRPGLTKADLVAELTGKMMQAPGYVPGFLQPIENRILMISTGIRAQLGVKILGDDLDALQRLAFDVERVVSSVPGAVGVAPSRVQAKPYLEIEVDRRAAARHGLAVADVLRYVEAGMGGASVTTTIEGRERFPIQVRIQRGDREDIERLAGLPVGTPEGRAVPLGQVAQIRRVIGPSEIASENGRLRVFVQANVQDRDLGGFVAEVRERVQREIVPRLPPGVTIEYSGEYEHQLRAERTLRVIVPACVLVIFLLLYVVYRSAAEAAHVILAVPFALSGGVFLQWLLGHNFSVAVWVGYIALFGIAIQTGIVMVVYLEEAVAGKRAERGTAFNAEDLLDAVKAGARLRLRPKVMTVATTVASLLPIMWSTRAGAEVMQPLAAPVIGGSLSSLVHILIVTPVIFAWLRGRKLPRDR